MGLCLKALYLSVADIRQGAGFTYFPWHTDHSWSLDLLVIVCEANFEINVKAKTRKLGRITIS